MRAYRYTGQHKAELAEVPIPEPRYGDVLVRVGASGACHSDLGILAAPPGAFPAPPRSATRSRATPRASDRA